MEKPTCPAELLNEIKIVDLTTQGALGEPPENSLQRGLALAANYLQSSVKSSTLNQVNIYFHWYLKLIVNILYWIIYL